MDRGPHLYAPFERLLTRREAEAELARACGRFAVPELTEDRLAQFIVGKLKAVDRFEEDERIVVEGTPLNWQSLLGYLYKNGITSDPRIQSGRRYFDRPHFPTFILNFNDVSRKTDGSTSMYRASGTSTDVDEAMGKCIGETLERYFLSIYTKDTMIYASYESLQRSGQRTFDIHALNGFRSEQKAAFPLLANDDTTPFRWVEGSSYADNKKILLPAQLVYWNYQHDDEHILARTTSSGCAGGFSKDEATLGALFELIERDAFLIYWLNGLSPRVLDVSLFKDRKLDEFLAYFERYHLKLTFLNTSSELGVPCITCVMRDDQSPNGPILSIGSSAGFDIPRAIMHSALEAHLVGEYATAHKPYVLTSEYKPFNSYINRERRLCAWRGIEMVDRFDFFVRGRTQDPRELVQAERTEPEQLQYIVRALEKKGYALYLYEVSDHVLKSLGFHVVRAIVPELVPLYLIEHAAPLDAKRLREVPKLLGFEAADTFIPWPHPFP